MKYHFIGIKGSGMSSLAQILHDLGNQVQGSDVEKEYFTQLPLEKKNITILPFSVENIKEGWTIIAGNAFKEDHIEINACIQKNIPFIRYHEFLKDFMTTYKSIAVSGAHGKTTTTGLLSHVLSHATPTSFLIGDGTGKGVGESTHFVFEACEYRRHFLAYHPNYTIITNIDFDHPDYFQGIDDVKAAFASFANQTKEKIVACGDDPVVQQMDFEEKGYLYGLQETNDVYAENITIDKEGTHFDIRAFGKSIARFSIPLYGNHQILNTLAIITVCLLEEIGVEKIKEALLTYPGVKRRFSETTSGTNILIDDYAHHPTEIKATIDSVKKKYPEKKLVTIFQPHTFTRTKTFLAEFAASFKGADRVYLVDIFASARENNGEISIHDLIQKTENAYYLTKETIHLLESYENSVLVFMGAGDIQNVQKAYELKKKTFA